MSGLSLLRAGLLLGVVLGVSATLVLSSDASTASYAPISSVAYALALAGIGITYRGPLVAAFLDPRTWAAVFTAWMLSLHAAPTSLDWLHWISYVPLFWALRADDPRGNRRVAYLWGVASFAIIYRWIVATITLFSSVPTDLATVALLLFSMSFGAIGLLTWPFVHPIRRRIGAWWVVVLPCLVVLVEWLSMHVLLFPYNHGITQYRNPYVFQIVSVTGVWSLTWLIFFTNGAIAEAIYRAREGRLQTVFPGAAAVSLLSAVVIFGVVRFDQVEEQLRAAPQLRVAQLQTSMDMTQRLEGGARRAFQAWHDMTERLEPGSVDLVVWPEGGSPFPLNTGRAADYVSEQAAKGGFEMLVGGGLRERVKDPHTGRMRSKTYNTVYWYDKEGNEIDRYSKMVPLPFGEYMPLANLFPFLHDLIQGPGDFDAGAEPVVAEGIVRMAAPICYEAILAHVCRRFADPELLVNITNDGWFGDTAAPHQHAMLAAARATELGVPMFRSAYTGVSMVVEPHGHIYAETEPFTDVVDIVTVRMGRFDTPYKRYGDWFVGLCALVFFGTGVVAPWLPSREASPAD